VAPIYSTNPRHYMGPIYGYFHIFSSNSAYITEDLPSDEWCYAAVDEFCRRVKQGLEDNPAAFKPAMVKMNHNILTYAPTESGLLTTLHTMGKYSGLPIKRKFTAFSGRRRGGVMIGMQPTAVKRRKSCLSGRRKLCGGRPMQTVTANRNFKKKTFRNATVITAPGSSNQLQVAAMQLTSIIFVYLKS